MRRLLADRLAELEDELGCVQADIDATAHEIIGADFLFCGGTNERGWLIITVSRMPQADMMLKWELKIEDQMGFPGVEWIER